MNRTRITTHRTLIILLLLTAVLASACKAGPSPTIVKAATAAESDSAGLTALVSNGLAFPAVPWAQSSPCEGNPACERLYVLQNGQVNRLNGPAQGLQAQALPMEKSRYVMDTGSPSPDGNWIAFTSIGYETGGPVWLQNTASGEWTNLIAAVNQAKPGGQEPLPEDWLWSIIGWFPDSQRLLVGPADLARVDVIDTQTHTHQMIPIQTAGMSGSEFVDLAPDGRGFTYLGVNAEQTEQVLYTYTLSSGETSVLLSQPFQQGRIKYPRYAPDGRSIAYILREGHPTSGLTYAIDLLNVQAKTTSELMRGNLSQTALHWSPDGRYIAFTQQETAAPLITAGGTASPEPVRSNVWVVSVTDKIVEQITFIDGQARSPAWAGDAKTLAFITHDGQVGVTSIDQPGTIWQAAGPSPETPYLSNAFFLP